MLRAYVGTFLSLAGATVGLTWLYLGMRSVMEIGGACASGGPYEIAQPCPEGVPLLMVGGIVGGLVCVALFVMFASRLGGSYATIAGFAWPALFVSLGWNFLEYGLDPPGEDDGLVWGWLVCAGVFFAMGALPLLYLAAPANLRRTFWPPDADPLAPSPPPPPIPAPLGASLRLPTPPRRPPRSDDVVAQLERLAALRDRGAIDAEEYERAKQEVLGG